MTYDFKNLLKKYGDKIVLDIDEFMIQRKKITCIIGGNGAGKSTLLNQLEEVIATNGNKSIGNKDLSYVWQQPYLFDLPIVKNIEYPMLVRGKERAEIKEKTDIIIKMLRLEDFRNRKPDTLSGGEKQRVSLGRSIIFGPDLLLLDEPTANIDPLSRKLIEDVILNLKNEHNTTIVWVTHSITQAQRVADQIVFMDKGKIIEQGRSKDILLKPSNDLTKEFIKSEVIMWEK